MRTKRAGIALVGLLVLAGWAACVHADVAATVNPGYPQFSALRTFSTTPWDTDYRSYGWRFFVKKPISITHLGLFDFQDNGLSTTHRMGIWMNPNKGGLRLVREVEIGPGGVAENHHVYVDIEDLTIEPNDAPYYKNGIAYYERWLVGVWTGSGNTEELLLRPVEAATLDIQVAGIINFENYTWRPGLTTFPGPAPYFGAPWGETEFGHHFGVNFKYDLVGPKAEAGDNVAIYTSEQALTTVVGSATHTVPGTPVQYRWLEGSEGTEGSTVLRDWTADVGPNGEASLSLAAPVAPLSIGAHTLTLEVRSGSLTASDTMVLTVDNTPPDAQPGPTAQIVSINVDAIIVTAEVADFDGDAVAYQWLKGGEVLASGTVNPPAGGAIVVIPDLEIPAGDPRFPFGTNSVELAVNDGVNPAVSASVTVEVDDTTAPTLTPTSSVTLLWPANHTLRAVTVWAGAEDNGGGPITLTATVVSNEPDDGESDGTTGPDCSIESIDQQTGTIYLNLCAERSGTGEGRVYTICITATDGEGNPSSANMEVRVPHDRRKK